MMTTQELITNQCKDNSNSLNKTSYKLAIF